MMAAGYCMLAAGYYMLAVGYMLAALLADESIHIWCPHNDPLLGIRTCICIRRNDIQRYSRSRSHCSNLIKKFFSRFRLQFFWKFSHKVVSCTFIRKVKKVPPYFAQVNLVRGREFRSDMTFRRRKLILRFAKHKAFLKDWSFRQI